MATEDTEGTEKPRDNNKPKMKDLQGRLITRDAGILYI
jgi:hypothetical protein